MQVSQPLNFQSFQTSQTSEIIETYLGRQIYLTRISAKVKDKGLWLHWCHPDDVGTDAPVKYGHFWSPDRTFQDILHEVYCAIEASIELELFHQQKPSYLKPSSSQVLPKVS